MEEDKQKKKHNHTRPEFYIRSRNCTLGFRLSVSVQCRNFFSRLGAIYVQCGCGTVYTLCMAAGAH